MSAHLQAEQHAAPGVREDVRRGVARRPRAGTAELEAQRAHHRIAPPAAQAAQHSVHLSHELRELHNFIILTWQWA